MQTLSLLTYVVVGLPYEESAGRMATAKEPERTRGKGHPPHPDVDFCEGFTRPQHLD